MAGVWGQSARIDSLMQILTLAQRDTHTLQIVANLAAAFENSSGYPNYFDSTWKYGELTLDLSYELGEDKYLGKAYGRMAEVLYIKNEYAQALAYADSGILYLKRYDNKWAVMSLTYMKALVSMRRFSLEDAITLLEETYAMAENLQDTMVMGVVLDGIGHVQDELEHYDLAEEQFKAAIDLLDDPTYAFRQALSRNNLGSMYHQQSRYEEAIATYQLAIEAFEQLDNPQWLISTRANMASSLSALGRHAEAIPLMEAQLGFYRDKHHNPERYGIALGMLADVYRRWQKPDSATKYYQGALDYLSLDQAPQEVRRIHEKLAETFEMKGDFPRAYPYLAKAKLLGDSLFQSETDDKIQQLTQRFEAEKREAKIIQLAAENELKDAQIQNDRQTKIGLAGGALLLGIIGFLGWNTQRRKRQHERTVAMQYEHIRATEFKQTLTELELKALRAQMNPHFIFNCMNSINRLILADQNEQASRSLTKFSKLIRQILEHSEKKTIGLQAELDMLETYIQLEAQRFKGQISYEINVDAGLDTAEIELPSMVLQPFIENAIWHGLMHKEGNDGKLFIHIEEQNDVLKCIIEDNGVGREKALQLRHTAAIPHKSMGMTVTRDRLSLLRKAGLGELVRIIDLKDAANQALGTRVEVSIPL